MNIAVTGSVASGKTTLAKYIAKNYGLQYINCSQLAKKKLIPSTVDSLRRCLIIDPTDVSVYLKKKNIRHAVIDSHFSHDIPGISAILCTSIDIQSYMCRLDKRKYSRAKKEENLDAHILEICLSEAKQKNKPLLEVQTTKPLTKKDKLLIDAFLKK
jgi:adenylate kinase